MPNIKNIRIILVVYLHVWVSVERGSQKSGRTFVSGVREQGAEENGCTGVKEGL
jgi:hypothetical protein